MGSGAALEGVLIRTPKCVCLLKHIRDKILKGQTLFSKRMSFSASVFYWNNSDEMKGTPKFLPEEADERKGNFVIPAILYSFRVCASHILHLLDYLTLLMTLPGPVLQVGSLRLRESCPRSHSQEMAEVELKPGPPNYKAYHLFLFNHFKL